MSDNNFEVEARNILQKQTDSEDDQCFNSKKTSLSLQYTSRLDNLQKISQKKKNVLALPHEKKLLKLAVYSKCQVYSMISKSETNSYCVFFSRLKTVNV